ncbi:MAG: cell division protein ZapA [Muribaculaceae bacterium]|nr:cell division protein ZapA [Muribaculaceae bacterium]
MKNTDLVKMILNIGGEHIPLTVPFDRQDAMRDAEKAVSQLYAKWRSERPTRSDKEIMAMVAHQFAYLYQGLLAKYEHAIDMAAYCEHRLSEIIENENSKDF